MDFVCWKFKQIAKIGFWKGKSAEPSNVFTLPKLEIFISENVKFLKNVFTLGPTAQATLVIYYGAFSCIKEKENQKKEKKKRCPK